MKLIRVNMTTKECIAEAIPGSYQQLGGRGLTTQIISDEVDPRCVALAKENKLVIAPGLLNGTAAPCTSRTSIGAKSPLTGTIKESNIGGIAGQYLAGHKIKAIIIEGQPEQKQYSVLVIDGNQFRLEQRDDLAGLGNYQVGEILKQEFGSASAVMSIGPAGEAGTAVATIAGFDLEGRPTRHAGRGGMGAVMGSKGLKAIVITRPANGVEAKDRVKFKEIGTAFAKSLGQSKKALTAYGTAVLVNVINETGGLPTRNFSIGRNEKVQDISGEKLHQLCNERGGSTGHPCSRGCVIRCSNIFNDAQGNYVTAGFEYETIALLGSNCGLNDLDDIAKLDYLCDDLGVDTMEMGITLGVAMEAGILPFGDFKAMKEAINSIITGNQLGKVFGQGAAVTGKVLGAKRVPVVKGQGISAYDPRALKGTGVTYATSTMGADHTAGNCLPGRGGLNCHQPEGQIQLSRDLQVVSMICDFLGICIFVGPLEENMPVFALLAQYFTGEDITGEKLVEQAIATLTLEKTFNNRAGIGKGQNDLPLFFRSEPLPNNGLVFDVSAADLVNFKF